MSSVNRFWGIVPCLLTLLCCAGVQPRFSFKANAAGSVHISAEFVALAGEAGFQTVVSVAGVSVLERSLPQAGVVAWRFRWRDKKLIFVAVPCATAKVDIPELDCTGQKQSVPRVFTVVPGA